VGQATEVKIHLSESAPMQIDGEPWEQHPATISLTHHGQVHCLAPHSTPLPQVPMLQVESGT
jgi:diacylglycerol kinase (ATP)